MYVYYEIYWYIEKYNILYSIIQRVLQKHSSKKFLVTVDELQKINKRHGPLKKSYFLLLVLNSHI